MSTDTPLSGELLLYTVMRRMLRDMIESIDDSDFYSSLPGGGNSPGWILGHIVVVHRFGCALLGGPQLDPGELAMFGPGSSPQLDPNVCPSKAKLLDDEEVAAAALIDAVKSAPLEVLDAMQPSPFLQQEFPRVRDLLSHVLASHLSMHVGQLSAWRRANGMPSILKI